MGFGWYFVLLPALSAWIAMLETDSVLVGQWMLSRPILLGPFLGLVCGELGIGLALGVLTELFCLESPPVGSALPLNGSVAAGCAVLLCAGPQTLPVAAAFPAGLAAGMGHRWLETRVRTWRAGLTTRALRSLEGEGAVDWAALLPTSLSAHLAMTGALVYLCVAAAGPGLGWVWDAAPGFFRRGLETGFRAALWIGLAALMHTLFRKG
ncbi:MAG: PTS sugar transporter subunit IIC [Elusimicrobiota bacterium]